MSLSQKQKILLVEDDLALSRVYQEYLKNETYEIFPVDTGKAALDAIDNEAPDAILLDLKLPDMDGIEILKHIQDRAFNCTVIVITAHGSVNTAVEAMQAGASDFMLKPFARDQLIYTLRHALERQQLNRIVKTFKEDFDRREFCGFIGSSLAMQTVYQTIEKAAPSRATIFITGESGTGKEVCAKAIHEISPRVDKPFITLNCGAIPKDLMESEIFGHVKGAFTGAIANRDGAAQQAHGGTLFLDEICEMNPTLQVKLLRFIQTGVVQKVGGAKSEKVDVRFICATNKDPWTQVKTGEFREDLYYRLHVIPIHLPPLRQREGDVMEIGEYFLNVYSKEESKSFTSFGENAKTIIQTHEWPGNVRQLQNAIRNAVVLHDGEILEAGMLPDLVEKIRQSTQNQLTSEETMKELSAQSTLQSEGVTVRPMWQVELEMIKAALDQCGDNVHKAAAALEISPSTIYRRMREDDSA